MLNLVYRGLWSWGVDSVMGQNDEEYFIKDALFRREREKQNNEQNETF